jgi:hypothetical protein
MHDLHHAKYSNKGIACEKGRDTGKWPDTNGLDYSSLAAGQVGAQLQSVCPTV